MKVRTPLIFGSAMAIAVSVGYFSHDHLQPSPKLNPFAKYVEPPPPGPYEMHAFGRVKFHPASGRSWWLRSATDTSPARWQEY